MVWKLLDYRRRSHCILRHKLHHNQGNQNTRTRMKTHVKLYHSAFGYKPGEFISCEVCGAPSESTHHIQRRGMGGTKKPDRIENLMALCTKHHLQYGDLKQWKAWLYKVHRIVLQESGVQFDEQWMQDQITRWEGYAENS